MANPRGAQVQSTKYFCCMNLDRTTIQSMQMKYLHFLRFQANLDCVIARSPLKKDTHTHTHTKPTACRVRLTKIDRVHVFLGSLCHPVCVSSFVRTISPEPLNHF